MSELKNPDELAGYRQRVINVGCSCDLGNGYVCEIHDALERYEKALTATPPAVVAWPEREGWWAYLDSNQKEVARWPAWMRGGTPASSSTPDEVEK